MPLTIKHLNADASFLLTFQPVQSTPPSPGQASNKFTILLDPWLSGPAVTGFSWFSSCAHSKPSCISSLKEIEVPDLVIISQNKTDHCHEPTLKELPQNEFKPQILAEGGAADTIRSWKHFDSMKIFPLKAFNTKKADMSIRRISVPPTTPNGFPGEVKVSFFSESYDMTGLHTAIGITYRPPPTAASTMANTFPPSPPSTPASTDPPTLHLRPSDRAVSVIFSPHGCNYRTIQPWVTSHLMSELALPLTALLHPFDRLTNPWFLGGNLTAGLPGGKEIAHNTHAKVWISAHDGEKTCNGVAVKYLTKQKYDKEEVEGEVGGRCKGIAKWALGTKVISLDIGEEMRLGQEVCLDCGKEKEILHQREKA